MAEAYSIVSQNQTTDINPSGTGFHNVWEVTFKVTSGAAKGTLATLTFPEDEHNAAVIADAIAAKVKALTDIASLGA